MTIPGRGESVGEAYIRIFADGSGLNRSIRDEFKNNDKLFREQGDKDHESYRKGFDKREERDPSWAHLVGEMRKGKGEFDRVGQFLGSETAENFRKSLEKELGDKNIADRIFRNVSRDTLASGDIDHFTRSFRDLSPQIARASRELAKERTEEEKANGERKKTIHGLEDLFKFIKTHDFGKAFGQGNRNNFINSFGNAIGVVVRSIALLGVAAPVGIGRVINSMRNARKEGENWRVGLRRLATEGITGLLNGLGALSVGILGMPVLFKVALGAIQLFLGPLVALIADLSAVIVALSSTIAFGLVGAIAPLLPLLGPLIFGFAAVGIALKGMTGKSKTAAAEIKKYFAPVVAQFKQLQAQVREGLFGKNNSNAKALSASLVPVLKLLTPLLKNTAGAIGSSLIAFTKALSGTSGKSFLQTFAAFSPVAINKLGVAFTHTFLGIGGILRNLVPFAQKMLDSLDKSTIAFDKFTNSKSGQDRMTRFFTGAAKSASLLWTFLKDVGKVLGDILSAGKSTGDSLFGSINKSLETYDKFLRSGAGQRALKGFFDQIKPFLGALGNLVGGFGKLFAALNNQQSQNILNTVLSSLGGLFAIIARNIPSVIPIMKDFATGISFVLKILGGIASFIGAHEDLFRPLIVGLGALWLATKVFTVSSLGGGIGGYFTGLRGAMAGTLTSTQKFTTGITSALVGVAVAFAGIQAGIARGGTGGLVEGGLSGAAGGALAGSIFGPGGIAAGAAIGAGIGTITTLLGQQKKQLSDNEIQVRSLYSTWNSDLSTTLGLLQQSNDQINAAIKQTEIQKLQASKITTPAGLQTNIFDELTNLGVPAATLGDAATGSAEALKQLNAELDTLFKSGAINETELNNIIGVFGNLNGVLTQSRREFFTTAEAAGKFPAIGKQIATGLGQLIKHPAELSVTTLIGLQNQLKSLGGQFDLTADQVNRFRVPDTALGNDDKAIRNTAAVREELLQLTAAAEAYFKKTGDAKGAAKNFDLVTASLKEELISVGYNKQAIDALFYTFAKPPPDVTLKINANDADVKKKTAAAIVALTNLQNDAWVASIGLDDAQVKAKLATVLLNLGVIKKGAKGVLIVDSTNPDAQLPRVLDALRTLGLGAKIPITTPGLDLALIGMAKVQSKLAGIYYDIEHPPKAPTLGGLGGLLPSPPPPTHIKAMGGILTSATNIRGGEAGPEAIVPLRRRLNQVDPSVRALSAYAQGLAYDAPKEMASGGVVGGQVSRGPTIVIGEGGAFVRTASTDAKAILAEVSARWSVEGY